MLTELFVKNLALIDSLKMSFSPGLNVLTGETGAGKSIIMGAVKLLLGERASSEFIRTGTENALVEGLFHFSSPEFKKFIGYLLHNIGLGLEEEDMLFLCRELSVSGRNICRINGRMVPLNVYRDVGQYLVEFHSQGQQQMLSRQASHQGLLDNLGGREVFLQRERVSELYTRWKRCQQEIEALYLDEAEKEKKLDILKFQYEEISSAILSQEEENILLEERRKINNREKLLHSLNLIYDRLYGGSEYPSVVDSIGFIQKELEGILKYDQSLDDKIPGIEQSLAVLTEISLEIKEYQDNLYFKEEDIEEIENRLDLINRLKRKYGPGVAEVLAYERQLKDEIDDLLDSDKKYQELMKTKGVLEESLVEESSKLRKLRQKTSHNLEQQVSALLQELEMPQAIFRVSLSKTEAFTSMGFDRIEFLFSANPGEELKPLSKVASGGEMSRIMLALRTVLAESDETPSVVFDEIDTGLGGASVQAVAEKIHYISKHRQVICVTHAPQIASMGQRHFGISKKIEGDRTLTYAEKIFNGPREKEIARMIDGAELTEITLKHAQEMLERGKRNKK